MKKTPSWAKARTKAEDADLLLAGTTEEVIDCLEVFLDAKAALTHAASYPESLPDIKGKFRAAKGALKGALARLAEVNR